jgi:hypothetical protein
VLTSEDKVRKNDLCGSVRAVYVVEKLPDVSGSSLEEAGRYSGALGEIGCRFPISRQTT